MHPTEELPPCPAANAATAWLVTMEESCSMAMQRKGISIKVTAAFIPFASTLLIGFLSSIAISEMDFAVLNMVKIKEMATAITVIEVNAADTFSI